MPETSSLAGPDEAAIAHWFRARGLSLLLRGTPAQPETSVAAAPVLVGAFLLSTLLLVPTMTTVSLGRSVGISLAAILVTWVASNLVRRRRPLAPVARIGVFESLAFVAVPTVVATTSPVDTTVVDLAAEPWALHAIVAAVVAVQQVLLLVLIVLGERAGAFAVAGFLFRQLWGSLGTSGTTLAASLPVSLGVVFFFFLNPGVWATLGVLPPVAYASVVALLLLLAGLFLGSSRHIDLRSLLHFDGADAVRASLAGTPLAGASYTGEVPVECPLARDQWRSVRLVAILSQLVGAVLVAVAVFGLFLAVGWLAVDGATVQAWTHRALNPLIEYRGLAHAYVLTTAHLKVAGFLATFAAFNFSLASATDARLRQDTRDTVTGVVRQAAALRLVLLGDGRA